MSKNIKQVYDTNPITTNNSNDLMYFGRSPYGSGNDTAMLFSSFSAQFKTLTNSHIFVGNASNVATDVAASGDLTLANTGAFTLNTVNLNTGSFGSATQVPVFNVNGKGLITSVTNTTITGTTPGGAAGGDLTGTYPNPTLVIVNGSPGSFGSSTQVPVFSVNGKGLVTSVTNTTISGTVPGGSAGGDLSGTYPNPTVAKINGSTLGTTTATSGNLLIGSGTQWVTNAMSGDITIGSSGVTAIGTNKVTNAQFRQSSALSLVGNSTNATANVTDIAAASDNQVFRRSGTAIGFGSINLAQSNTVGSSILAQGNGGTGTGSGFSVNGIIFQDPSGTTFSSTANLTYGASGLQLYNTMTLSIAGAVTAPTITTQLNIASSTQNSARITLTGQEFFQSSNTSTNGIALIVGVNRTGNRQLWISSSDQLAINNTNPVFRIIPGASGTSTAIDSLATDGSTFLPINFGSTSSATTLKGSSISLSGGDATAATGNLIINVAGKTLKIKQGSNACAGTGAVLVGGTVTVNTTAVATGDIILLNCTAAGGTQGIVTTSIVNATSFTITSSQILDTSTYSWVIIKAA